MIQRYRGQKVILSHLAVGNAELRDRTPILTEVLCQANLGRAGQEINLQVDEEVAMYSMINWTRFERDRSE